jgi:hypothetical protein
VLWRWPETGGDQHLAEFVVVQPGGVLLVVQPGVQDVSGRRTVKQVFFYRVPAEPGDRAQPAGDRRPGLAFGFQVTGEALDLSTTALEQADVALAAPGGVLPQDQRAGLADQARVAGQEPGGCANSNAAASSPATTPSRTLPPSAWDSKPSCRSPWNAATPAPSPPSKRPWSNCPRSGTRNASAATPDYPLRVAARDLHGLAILRDQKLATLPGVHRLTSTIVMKRIVDNRPVPLTTRGGQERATAAAPAITSDPKNTHRHDRASRSHDATRSHINQIRTPPEHRSI